MDVAHFMVRTCCTPVIEEVHNIHINYNVFRIKIMEEAQGMIGLLARRVAGVQSDSEEDLGGSEDRSVRWKDEEDKREDFDANSIDGGLNIEVITHDVVSRGTKGFSDKTFEELCGDKMPVVFKNNIVEQDFSPNV